VEEEQGILIMMGKDLVGDQMRGGKEDGMRDPHPSQKTTMMPRMTNSLTCFLESWPTL